MRLRKRERTRTANYRGHNPVLHQLSYPHSTPYGTRTHDPLIKSQVLCQLSQRRILVHKAGLGPAGLRFLAEDVFQLHHLCIWYAGRDSNPQNPVPETGMSSFASPAHNVAPGKGFEPLAVGLEPTMLPLHYPGISQPRRAESQALLVWSAGPVRTMMESKVVPNTAAKTTKLSNVGNVNPRCHL